MFNSFHMKDLALVKIWHSREEATQSNSTVSSECSHEARAPQGSKTSGPVTPGEQKTRQEPSPLQKLRKEFHKIQTLITECRSWSNKLDTAEDMFVAKFLHVNGTISRYMLKHSCSPTHW